MDAKTNTDSVIEQRSIETLIPYLNNARIHSDEQVTQIARSIEQFGFTIPILVDEDSEIIAGHGRLLGAQRLELESVPVIVARGWSKKQIKAYRIADNKLALNSSWDVGLLAAELEELSDFAELIGFSETELISMFKSEEGPDEFPESNEDIPTEHQCPSCGYRWSGAATTTQSNE